MVSTGSANPPAQPPSRLALTVSLAPGDVQENKILVVRHEAAEMLSISCRALDYLVAHKELNVRRIGSRVLIPVADLQRFSKTDHPERLVS